MDKFNIYVNEAELAQIASDPSKNEKSLAELVGLMEDFLERKEICQLYCYEDFFSLKIDGVNIAQSIFQDFTNGEIRDLIVRLQVAIAESEPTRANDAIVTGSEALSTRSIGGWISLASPNSQDWWNSINMHWVGAKEEIIPAIRKLFILLELSHIDLDFCAKYLFPNIHFHALPSSIKSTTLDYISTLPLYISHLAYLNDHSLADFSNETQPHVLIATAAAHGVEMSPESPKTHKNKAAMKERDITIDSVQIRCEWHTKLDNQRGRIHFYPWTHKDAKVKKICKDKVIVGKIVEHLT